MRLVPCVQCGAPFHAYEIDEHEDGCLDRKITCTLGCGVVLQLRAWRAHADGECVRRPLECALGCGARVPADTLDAHARGVCPLRSVQCPLECGTALQWANIAEVRDDVTTEQSEFIVLTCFLPLD
jgi:hypothetical protein